MYGGCCAGEGCKQEEDCGEAASAASAAPENSMMPMKEQCALHLTSLLQIQNDDMSAVMECRN
jgi:hypothetical protein